MRWLLPLVCLGWLGSAAQPSSAQSTLAQSTSAQSTSAQSTSAQSPMEDELVRLRQENRVAQVELERLRQVIARLEAQLAAVQDELERERNARRPDPGTAEMVPVVDGAAVEEEELTDEELGDVAEETTAEEIAAEDSGQPREALPAISDAARRLYDESYTLFHEKRYLESEEGFERFLDLYPNVDLADNAQFWIGECRYARGEYDEALEAFMATVGRFPDGNKVADALYKAGRCLEALDDSERAAATYEEVGRRFPSSAAATAARERLADMR